MSRNQSVGRSVGFLTLVLLSIGVTSAGEFPSFEQLPARPEPPDPLVMLDGTPVRTRDDWFNKRRPELKALFEHYMYGKAPPPPDNLTATIVRTDEKCLGGKATLREVTIKFGPKSAPPINLLLITPN
ncbi:MAG: acetylxylan esterase, partial [Planctomycetaceae bacterium]|nr:acetylxylan esterase [Planctomycetaceae bacterium]